MYVHVLRTYKYNRYEYRRYTFASVMAKKQHQQHPNHGKRNIKNIFIYTKPIISVIYNVQHKQSRAKDMYDYYYLLFFAGIYLLVCVCV
jgi:hypothetical protein